MSTFTSNTATLVTHEPYDGCDDCDINLMNVAEHEGGKRVPIERVFAAVKKARDGGKVAALR